jgi:hypothetical protein
MSVLRCPRCSIVVATFEPGPYEKLQGASPGTTEIRGLETLGEWPSSGGTVKFEPGTFRPAPEGGWMCDSHGQLPPRDLRFAIHEQYRGEP